MMTRVYMTRVYMTSPVTKSMAEDIIRKIPESKKKSLYNAFERTFMLTSTRILEDAQIDVYKEGFYLTLYGCRSSFSVFAVDYDGELVIINRKPNNSKLHYYYSDTVKMDEDIYKEVLS